jgi:hypothetical protein
MFVDGYMAAPPTIGSLDIDMLDIWADASPVEPSSRVADRNTCDIFMIYAFPRHAAVMKAGCRALKR